MGGGYESLRGAGSSGDGLGGGGAPGRAGRRPLLRRGFAAEMRPPRSLRSLPPRGAPPAARQSRLRVGHLITLTGRTAPFNWGGLRGCGWWNDLRATGRGQSLGHDASAPAVERRGASGPTLLNFLSGVAGNGVPNAATVPEDSVVGSVWSGRRGGETRRAWGCRRTRRRRPLTRADCPKPSDAQRSRASSARTPRTEHRSEPPAEQGAPARPRQTLPAGEAGPAAMPHPEMQQAPDPARPKKRKSPPAHAGGPKRRGGRTDRSSGSIGINAIRSPGARSPRSGGRPRTRRAAARPCRRPCGAPFPSRCSLPPPP